jgi:hypothetical protein
VHQRLPPALRLVEIPNAGLETLLTVDYQYNGMACVLIIVQVSLETAGFVALVPRTWVTRASIAGVVKGYAHRHAPSRNASLETQARAVLIFLANIAQSVAQRQLMARDFVEATKAVIQ